MSSILLVEPDQTLASIYKKALEGLGHSVVCRRTAESAVMALDATPTDLVILELNMALHNGIEFLYEMRSYPEWQSIQVILHTNVRKTQLNSPVLDRLDVSDYLYKPTTKLTQLQESVEAVLQKKT